MRIGVYPGTFDPITRGHRDVISKALMLVDRLIVAVADDTPKTPLFSLEERVAMVEQDIACEPWSARVEVQGFQGLLMDFASEMHATVVIRGLRAVSDFEYEFQLASMNSRLQPSIATVFMPASESTHFIASRLVKEVARLGGDVSAFVSDRVQKQLHAKYPLGDTA